MTGTMFSCGYLPATVRACVSKLYHSSWTSSGVSQTLGTNSLQSLQTRLLLGQAIGKAAHTNVHLIAFHSRSASDVTR